MEDPADTRWLTPREQQIWRSYMAANQALQARIDRQLKAESGMPVAYYEILVMLSESPGRSLRMTRLAELCNSSRSRLSHAVAALEKLGYVSRCGLAGGDRRAAVAQLTDAGYDALVRAAPGHVSEVRECLFDALSPEQLDALHDISETLQAALRQPR
ncbi:MarR family winged helix-turn-helix transcriptional regulator [Streptomyces sp. NPDC048172]|uniref:MarR family winged helix-turn-helix transcriptional regulator n=1 Tax=Streptomyces sp. NPDC048172 TaxID=3365505 RepID=UPI0037113F34